MRLRGKERAFAERASRRPRLLVVVAVEAERAAIDRGAAAASGGLRVVTLAGGVGVASAAAATAEAIGRQRYAAVVSAGIGGGITVPIGGVAIARASVAADLGAQTADGFATVDELGLGSSTVECDAELVSLVAARVPGAVQGSVLTVSTVTGTAERAATLRERHPDAVAEAMEGFGVGTAAARAGLSFVEVRAISNAVGPRDRKAWRISDALMALEGVGRGLTSLLP